MYNTHTNKTKYIVILQLNHTFHKLQKKNYFIKQTLFIHTLDKQHKM